MIKQLDGRGGFKPPCLGVVVGGQLRLVSLRCRMPDGWRQTKFDSSVQKWKLKLIFGGHFSAKSSLNSYSNLSLALTFECISLDLGNEIPMKALWTTNLNYLFIFGLERWNNYSKCLEPLKPFPVISQFYNNQRMEQRGIVYLPYF